METLTPHWNRLVPPVGFALICVVLSLLVLHAFGAALPLEAQPYRVDLPLPSGSNLVAGSDVQLSGVRIGRVAAVRRSGNAAVATLEIRSPFAPLHAGATAMVRTKTLLGEGYVDI